MNAKTRCANCAEPIVPDPDDEYVHAEDGVAGCGAPFQDTEVYATPATVPAL